MHVRAGQASDITQILDLMRQLASHHGDALTANAHTLRRDLFGPVPWGQVLVADDGDLLGYALLMPLMRAYFGQRGMDVHHLFVADHARGRGIGRALLLAAQAHAQELGCEYMTVSTTKDNAEARDFYMQSGFHPAPPSPWRYAIDLRKV